MLIFDPDLMWPVVGSILAGAIIGIEREYRASPAGCRTHILVCLSSALLMLAAVHQIRWLTDTPSEIIRIDPVRMAHGILTGVGFLCGGVIFREGFTVRGLTTAASLWTTSALGILFGVGFFGLALLGAGATLAVLAAVTLTGALLSQRRYADVKVIYQRGAPADLDAFRRTLGGHGLKAQTISQVLTADCVEFSAIVAGYDEARARALFESLRRDPQAVRFESVPRTP